MSVQITILSDTVGSGKTTFLKSWIKSQTKIAGVLSPKINGKRYFEIFPSGKLFPMESEVGTLEIGKYQFDNKAFQKTENLLWDFFNNNEIKTLVIDEIGPLEIKKNQGFHKLLQKIVAAENQSDKSIILVIRDSCLQDFITKYPFKNIKIKSKTNWIKNETLIGLILCGGKSQRMNTDKALVSYHAIPQWRYLYTLLSSLCDEVYLSLNENQIKTWNLPQEINYIKDCEEFLNHGPMTGLLSATRCLDTNPILITGCDYPNLRLEHLFCLLKNRDTSDAICFEKNGYIEPLIAVLEKQTVAAVTSYFYEENDSLRKFLETRNTKKILPESTYFLLNANTAEIALSIQNAPKK